jgi:hypothetical protein
MGHALPSFGAFALGEFADANGIAQIYIFENISPSFLLTRISSDAELEQMRLGQAAIVIASEAKQSRGTSSALRHSGSPRRCAPRDNECIQTQKRAGTRVLHSIQLNLGV